MQASANTDSYLLTFHYSNGANEVLQVSAAERPENIQDMGQWVRYLMDRPYIVFQTGDQTTVIRIEHVVKIDITPPTVTLQGPDTFSRAMRVTALTRGSRR
ncbi:MAG: hypothetical protein AAF685_02540 [Cyanobacteria bacterium P01_C01_bin.89]